jgi:hypothetical protein
MSMTRNALAAAAAALVAVATVACTRDDATTQPAALPDAAETPADAAAPGDLPATGMEPVPADPAMPGACNADAIQSLVGQPISDAVTEQARTESGSESVRVLRPGDAATMDFRPDRLNIELDGNDVIQSLRCG